MYRVAWLALTAALVTGCGPSFEAEYQATLKELDATKRLLAEAQQKLSAADHQTRSKIFALARRANTHLTAEPLDRTVIEKIQQEMALLSQSYAQFNAHQDLATLTAQFYADKLTLLLELEQDSRAAYDRQYTACLSDLDSQGKKNDLSTMLCEVQANAAGRKPSQRYSANLSALQQLGKQLMSARQLNTPLEPQQLEQQYQIQVEQQLPTSN